MPTTTFWSYCKRFSKQLWRHCFSWTRDNIVIGLILLLAPPTIGILQHHSLSPDWKQITIAVYVYIGLFVLYVLYHLPRTAWKLDVESQQETEKMQAAIEKKDAEIESLAWANDHPVIRLIRWGVNPSSPLSNHRGFLLRNSGGVCLAAC